MVFRFILGSLSRVCHRSLVFDVQVNMPKKRQKLLGAHCSRLCSSSAPQTHLEDSSVDDQKTDPDKIEESQEQNLKYLIVGLGNPDISRSRHSVGMMFVNILAKQLGIRWTRNVFKTTGGFTAKAMFENVEISLLKPRVPMNLNGTSVIKSVRHFNVDPENVYLVHDELDKHVGEFQLKSEGGSANGHNGVKSVMNSLKNDTMPRIKIGIDRPAHEDAVPDYVLEDFSSQELQAIRVVIDESTKALLEHIGKKSGVNLVDQMGKYVDMFDHDEGQDRKKGFRSNKQNYPRYRDNRSRYHYDEDFDGARFSKNQRHRNNSYRNDFDDGFRGDRIDHRRRFKDDGNERQRSFQDNRANHRRSFPNNRLDQEDDINNERRKHLYDNDE